MVGRLLMHEGFDGVRLVGRSSDGGADVVARAGGKRWLFQAKRWSRSVGSEVVDETVRALSAYRADVPVIVSLSGFDEAARRSQTILMSRGIPLQLWDRGVLLQRAAALPEASLVERQPDRFKSRPYQEAAIEAVLRQYFDGNARKAMIVMATGLGKTFVAAEVIRRMSAVANPRVLALAHTNELVYQLERSFWPLLKPSQETTVWNGPEKPEMRSLERANLVFACIDSVAAAVNRGSTLPKFDVIIIDECHHAGASMYEQVIAATAAGSAEGPFLFGLTATPWRADAADLDALFGRPLVTIDLVTGMRNGFLANVDYRMYTSNIDWERLRVVQGHAFSPKAINREMFISEWDDSVVYALQAVWNETVRPRAIVFCGTIVHAIQMRDRINAVGFCQAAAVYSASPGAQTIQPWERSRIVADFDEGKIGTICAVDIFNEGIDVPDVNILVFQRVTHSRRIFIQQLGRGLRLAPGKDSVVVLDFVSDVRRFAAGLELKDQLTEAGAARLPRVRLNSQVRFVRVGADDPQAETFLRQWLEDVAAIEQAGDDSSVLKYPPALPQRVGAETRD